MYRVIQKFTDLQDGGHVYNVGDSFPRNGVAVSASRIEKLSGEGNRQGVPLIVKEMTALNPATPAQPDASRVVQEPPAIEEGKPKAKRTYRKKEN